MCKNKCHTCDKDYLECISCSDFENYVSNITDIYKLKHIRKYLMRLKPALPDTFSGRIADFLVSKVGTMQCFYTFIALATIPLIVPSLMTILGYISSGYLQLILLPLIMVASNRADSMRQQQGDREWKINLVSGAIDELMDNQTINMQKEILSNDCREHNLISMSCPKCSHYWCSSDGADGCCPRCGSGNIG